MTLPLGEGDLARRRAEMVERQLRARGITDPRVLTAMGRVPRHAFVQPHDLASAYGDFPLDIGFGQTISQPYIVAYMTEALALPEGARVLEIGTGSAYQTAVVAEIAREVYSIEIVPEHAARARDLLHALGYPNVSVRVGDGYHGWPEAAPFDGILVTAAPEQVPPPLIAQLKVGGRLVVPVGRFEQELQVLTRTAEGVTEQARLAVRFVPLVRDHKD